MTALVVDLREVGRDDLDVAGGKGANLGELMRAGFPVPAGFVVTTAAYDRFMAEQRMQEDVERACRTAYARLGGGPVAVRSSATAEDLPGAAFAGQHETYLNVIGVDAVLQAIQQCWGSLFTDRARAYRAHVGTDEASVKLAVVVQRLVPADVAGVLFTANPLTGDRRETAVDASPGLGEAVVGGLVTPDHFVLRKSWSGWRVVERRLGRREVVVRARAEGGTEHVSLDVRTPALTRRQVRRLARLAAAIERLFGPPQDVEWALSDGRLFILQARPMTALPIPRGHPLPRPIALMAAELFAVRPYPLDLTVWAPSIFGAVSSLFEVVGMAEEPFDRIFVEEDGVAVALSGRLPVRPTAGVLLTPVRLTRLALAYDPTRWASDSLLTDGVARAAELDSRDLPALSWAELLDTLHEATGLPRSLAGEVRRRYFPRPALAAGGLYVLLKLLGHERQFAVLLSGADTKTLEANRALDALAADVRSNPRLVEMFAGHQADTLWNALEADAEGQNWLGVLRSVLERYGHREAAIATAALPTWRDDPTIVLGIVKGLALQPSRTTETRPPWQTARAAVLRSPLLRLPPLKTAFDALLTQARYLLQIREDTHFYATLPLPLVRRIVLELGRRLVAQGALERPEDVFHLKLRELERADDVPVRSTVERRRARRAALEATPLVEFDGQRAQAGEADDAVLLRGVGGSPGVADGPARVIRNGSEFGKLLPGDVLVAPYTNPGWTPLFQHAAAVVADTGGAASHAAIVAREYGIPAVMATVDGTRRLVDGQRVRVDGTRGLVVRPSD